MTVDALDVLDLLAIDADRSGASGDFEEVVEDATMLAMSMARRRFLLPSLRKPALASTMKMPMLAWTFSLSTTTMQAGMLRIVGPEKPVEDPESV